MTDDGSFRLMAARVTDTVRGVVAAQKLSGEAARQLGQLVCAAVLYRETMAPTLRVQIALQGADGSGHLLADSNPEGWSRGLSHRTDGQLVKLGSGMLQMIRSLPSGDLHRGVVQMPESGDISEGVMSYMQSSEQIATMVAVDVTLGGALRLGLGLRATGGGDDETALLAPQGHHTGRGCSLAGEDVAGTAILVGEDARLAAVQLHGEAVRFLPAEHRLVHHRTEHGIVMRLQQLPKEGQGIRHRGGEVPGCVLQLPLVIGTVGVEQQSLETELILVVRPFLHRLAS